jgi:hypothetical protein
LLFITQGRGGIAEARSIISNNSDEKQWLMDRMDPSTASA